MSKTFTGLTVALAAALSVSAAFADDEQQPSTTTTQSTTTTAAPATPPPAYPYGGGPAYTTGGATTTTTTTVSDDDWSRTRTREPERAHVRPGFGLNVFGAAGTKETAALGLGGRIEFVMPFGLTLGGSYTQNFTSNSDKTAVRPLLGEIGMAIPVVNHLEVRPMVGLGYAFANASSSGDSTDPSVNQSATASASVSTSGFDVAPGAKISYVGSGLEVFTMPKYHFISGNNFFGIELGAGARF